MNDTTTQFPYNPDHPIGTCSDCGEEMVFNVPRLGQAGGYIHKSGKQCQRSVVKDSFTTADTTTNDKCPHCGAEEKDSTPRYFKCGTWLVEPWITEQRPELCHEREARQKLEAEVAETEWKLVVWRFIEHLIKVRDSGSVPNVQQLIDDLVEEIEDLNLSLD